MAYNFGQFLSSNRTDYLTDQAYEIRDLPTREGDLIFINKQIETSMNYSEEDEYCYYLKFKIKKLKDVLGPDNDPNYPLKEGEQNITIRLKHSDSASDSDRQLLTTITVPKTTSDEDEYATFDLIITPNDNYNEIQFILNRKNRYDDRQITLNVLKFAEIINLVPLLESKQNLTLKQIGVQGRTGLQMCINGEPIKIGRTRIYEINHGYTIYFLGFIYYTEDLNDELEPFILDYQY